MYYNKAFKESWVNLDARAALQKALDSKTKFMERDAAQKLLDSLPAGGK